RPCSRSSASSPDAASRSPGRTSSPALLAHPPDRTALTVPRPRVRAFPPVRRRHQRSEHLCLTNVRRVSRLTGDRVPSCRRAPMSTGTSTATGTYRRRCVEMTETAGATPASMKAVVMHAPEDYRLEDKAVPSPAADELLIKVQAVGV